MIVINVSGGVVQQVLSDDENAEVMLFDEDNLKEDGIGEYLREKLLDTLVRKHGLKSIFVGLPDADEALREDAKSYIVHFHDKHSSETRTLTVPALSEEDAEQVASVEADKLGWPHSFKVDSAELAGPA